MNRKPKLIILCFLYVILALFAAAIIALVQNTDNSSTEVMASMEEESEELSTENQVVEENSEEEITEEEITEVQTSTEETMEIETTSAIQEKSPKPFYPIEFTNKTKSNVHIRSKGSMNGKIIGKIPPGKKGIITDFLNTEWAVVSYNELHGYSAFRYFLFDKELDVIEDRLKPDENILPSEISQEEVSQEEASQEEVSQEETPDDIVTIINNCYIRSSTNSHTMENVIDIAKKENTYPHDVKNDTDYWCCIILTDGRLGFVSRGFTDCP